jgi:hypothetical protein
MVLVWKRKDQIPKSKDHGSIKFKGSRIEAFPFLNLEYLTLSLPGDLSVGN